MKQSIATYIDHTLLKQDATKEEIKKLCDEAKKYGFASVCVNPYWVTFVKEQLTNSGVDVCTVIGFPLGATTTNVKKYEAIDAIENGATELDVVINISALKDRDDESVLNDIKAIVDVAKEKAIVKVIIETSLLTDEEKVRACELAVKAGAHYVKTSTGFSSHGATVSDVALMRKTVGEHVGVKASGGIRTYQDARSMIEAGATRIGASRGVEIVKAES